MKNAIVLAMSSRAYGRNEAYGKSLDRETSRRSTSEELSRIAHQRSGRHEGISIAQRFERPNGRGDTHLGHRYAY